MVSLSSLQAAINDKQQLLMVNELSIVPLQSALVVTCYSSSSPPPLDSFGSTTSTRTLCELSAREVGRFPPLLHKERLSKASRISYFYSEGHLS